MQKTFDYSKEITQHIVDGLQITFLTTVVGSNDEFLFHNKRPYTLAYLFDFIHPHVASGLSEREEEVIQAERLRTVLLISQFLPLAQAASLISDLGYQITVK